MELYQIRHFVAVAETGSFTRGADRAGVSQPAISASIAKLEAELDVKLLDRQRSLVIPTTAGGHFLEAARDILHAADKLKAEVRSIAASKVLKIGILQSLSNRHVSNLLSTFRRSHPDIAIEVSDGLSDKLLKALGEHKIETMITILDGALDHFESIALLKESFLLAVPAGHRLAFKDSVTFSDLDNESFIVRPERDRYQDASKQLALQGVRIRVVYETDQIDRTLALVAAGIGLAFVPAHFDAPSVKRLPVPELDYFRTYGLLWPKERKNQPLEQFVTFATTHGWKL
jgi:DNA-binding transcriptional LysR family regulator